MNVIRVWKEIDVADIDKHLIIVDDLHGYCNSCKKSSIAYKERVNSCPECKTDFKYVTTRENPNSVVGQKILQKIYNAFPDALIIDYSDYKHLSDKKKAGNLFNI